MKTKRDGVILALNFQSVQVFWNHKEDNNAVKSALLSDNFAPKKTQSLFT